MLRSDALNGSTFTVVILLLRPELPDLKEMDDNVRVDTTDAE